MQPPTKLLGRTGALISVVAGLALLVTPSLSTQLDVTWISIADGVAAALGGLFSLVGLRGELKSEHKSSSDS